MLPRRIGSRAHALIVVAALASCHARSSHRSDPPPAASASSAIPSASSAIAPRPSSSASAPPAAPSAAPSSSASAFASASSSAKVDPAPSAKAALQTGVCHVTRGPIQLPYTGPATLVAGAADGDAHILFNHDGVPRAVTLPPAAKVDPKADPHAAPPKSAAPKKPERLALSETPERATTPGCAAALGSLFCIDRSGAIHRSKMSGEGSTVVAQARIGSPIAAAPIAGSHTVYAFLADRKTTEGATTLAFVAIDDAIPTQLSEDGSGATFVTLAPRGEEALAMYIDARRVLTPVHARVLTGGAKLTLGADAVVFVGSGTDGRTPGALAHGGTGHALALLPIDKDDKDFGMAAIRIEEQPRDDAAVTWSTYPAALERPVIAATQGQWPVRVLRARPAGADPKGKKVLELGEVDAAGIFKDLCPVAEGSKFADLAITADRVGSLWIAYTDGDGTWVERRGD